MIPAAFEYFAPASVQEALSLAQRYGSDAKFLSGGHSLLPVMKMRLAAPKVLIDLARIAGMREILAQGERLRVGALATHHDVETSESVRNSCPLLSQTASEIGDPQVRNRGTIGGSVAHSDPAADYPAALLALDAEMELQSVTGNRRIAAGDFYVDLFTSALGEGELLVAVHVPVLKQGTGTAYQKLRHQASGFAVAGVAALLEKNAAGECIRIAVAVTGVGPRPFRASNLERALLGKVLNERNITKACREVASEIEALSDMHASGEYRKAVADVLVRRALVSATERART